MAERQDAAWKVCAETEYVWKKGKNRMKPIIGVMPLWDEDKNSIWMLPDYLEAVKKTGGVPFVFPFLEEDADILRLTPLCDGFLFTGGQDVAPLLYGEEEAKELGECCEKRDHMEQIVLKEALREDKPVFGICRGIQLINAALGGSLYQDLPTMHPSRTCHSQPAPYDVPSHEVQVLQDTPLRSCIQKDRLSVNSCHHQAIKDPAQGLQAMALSPDGLIEAMCRPDSRFLWAVQWHPEFLFEKDENSQKLFRAFIQACEA